MYDNSSLFGNTVLFYTLGFTCLPRYYETATQ